MPFEEIKVVGELNVPMTIKKYHDATDDQGVLYLSDYNLVHYLICKGYPRETLTYFLDDYQQVSGNPGALGDKLPPAVMVLN